MDVGVQLAVSGRDESSAGGKVYRVVVGVKTAAVPGPGTHHRVPFAVHHERVIHVGEAEKLLLVDTLDHGRLDRR